MKKAERRYRKRRGRKRRADRRKATEEVREAYNAKMRAAGHPGWTERTAQLDFRWLD